MVNSSKTPTGSDLKQLLKYWFWESEILEAAGEDTTDKFMHLMLAYHELDGYINEKIEKEKGEIKSKAESKIRKKLLEEQALKDALEKAKQEGLSSIGADFQKIYWSELASPCKKVLIHLWCYCLKECSTNKLALKNALRVKVKVF